MAASARIREELVPAGSDWISALKSTDIRKLAKGPTADVPVPDAVAEIASPDFPGERLMVCFKIMFQKFCKKLSRKFGHGKSLGFTINHPLNRK